MPINSSVIRHLAMECGFDLVGVAGAGQPSDFGRFQSWAARGLAGEMRYLTDHRADIRGDLKRLLPDVASVICVGLVYNGPEPYSTRFDDPERGWISRYAWGDDYHEILRAKLEWMELKLRQIEIFNSRVCVDTAPLLERSLAAHAGLGWIGKNTCLIDQKTGSWFFLGELLTSLQLEPDTPVPDRCGTCTRCIDACPTEAIVPSPDGRFELDARRCISYFTIELRDSIPEKLRASMGPHLFGCDICQDVCPWNSRAIRKNEPIFAPREFAPSLERMASIGEVEFREMFRHSPVSRAKYRGFLRNVAVAMGNSGLEKFREPLTRLAGLEDPLVAEHARWAIGRLGGEGDTSASRGAFQLSERGRAGGSAYPTLKT